MKHANYILLLALCLALTACGPKETVSDASLPAPGASSSDVSRAGPDASEPDSSAPDVSAPDAPAPDSSAPDASSHEEPLPSLTEADKAAAYDAACDYYLGTVFEVDALTEIAPRAGEITFQVSCSKGGVKVDPDRTISLERKEDAWSVVSEGY